ncbi:MAG TPA: hypothetical protein VFG65_06330 [Fimbriimonadales bacterium]|nr:hypothetical protein [Fimbriimonadales bacterium]
MRSAFVAVLSLLLLGLAKAEFIELGFLTQGFSPSIAYAVSADGSTVVGESNSMMGWQGFQYRFGVGMRGIGDLPGGFFSSAAYGCSADGSLLAGMSDDGSAGEGGSAIRWTQAGGMQSIGNLGGPTTYGQGQATSANGSIIVGGSQSPAGIEAYRWTAPTGMVSLGDLPGSSVLARATAISGDGTVIVGYGSHFDTFDEAFRWTSGTGMVGLGGNRSAALGISFDGRVIVGSRRGRAMRWTEEHGFVDLPLLNGGPFNYWASSTSGDGAIIVGLANFNATQGTGEAFIWDQEHGMRSLSSVLMTQYGFGLNGFFPFDARGISADGTVIAGYGFNAFGEQEAFAARLSQPPNQIGPSSFSVIRGHTVGGGIADLQRTDDHYLILGPQRAVSITQPAIDVIMRTTTKVPAPNRLRFRLEAAASGFPLGSIRQRIALFDYANGTWVTISEGPAAGADRLTEIVIDINARRFVDPISHEVSARASWFDQGTVNAGWQARIDMAGWLLTP